MGFFSPTAALVRLKTVAVLWGFPVWLEYPAVGKPTVWLQEISVGIGFSVVENIL